jgi:hypothetical protein
LKLPLMSILLGKRMEQAFSGLRKGR